MTAAMNEALAQPELREAATRVFLAKVKVLVPLEAFQMLMREVEARELDVQSMAMRHQSYAKVITEAWRLALDEVVEALRNVSSAA